VQYEGTGVRNGTEKGHPSGPEEGERDELVAVCGVLKLRGGLAPRGVRVSIAMCTPRTRFNGSTFYGIDDK
jgi:hypothetical protein